MKRDISKEFAEGYLAAYGQSDNELIAEFMQIKHEKDPFVRSPKLYWHYDKINLMAESLSFDTSWDWLMPVVDKIVSMKHPIYMYSSHIQKSVTIFQLGAKGDDERLVRNSDTRVPLIDQVYKAVVEFIKWYNSQPT
jgi:hypothetical protein